MGERGSSLLRNLDKFLGIPLTFPASLYRKTSRRPTHRSSRTGTVKIGVLCLGAIGDLLLVSALIDGLRNKNPSAQIELITSRANAGAIPLICNIDSAVSFSVKRPDQIISHVRQQNYSLFFDCSQWARIGNLISNLSGAAITVGFDTPGQYRKSGYSKTAPHLANRHELENFLALGHAVWPDFTGQPSLALPEDIDIEKWQMSGNTIFCHMWPASGKGRILKMWPENCWKDLIVSLLRLGYSVWLSGSPANVDESEVFCHHYFPDNEKVRSIAGKANLLELAALMGKAAGTVAVNTGIMHLSALLGTPTVGLHGATNPLRWGPVGPHCVSLLPRTGEQAYLNLGFEYPAHACNSMGNIDPADVLEALENLTVLP